jgi:carbonic anhydrase/acetyltransferase-like protein (isoleucine patch superfamily)
MPILPYHCQWPRIASDAFIAPTAVVAGNVTIESGANIWFGAVIRADSDEIVIGRDTNVQDNCVLHTDAGAPCIIGEACTLGHGAVVHGCRLGARVLIGMHATVLSGAAVGSDSIVAAGAVVPENREIADGMLAMGIPAKAVRPTTPEERQRAAEGVQHYLEYARVYREALGQQSGEAQQ